MDTLSKTVGAIYVKRNFQRPRPAMLMALLYANKILSLKIEIASVAKKLENFSKTANASSVLMNSKKAPQHAQLRNF